MLEDFKSEMLQALAMQMDTLHIKRKQEEAERTLAIFHPRCTKRHLRSKCPLNSIEVYLVCEEDHSMNQCPSLPRLKAVYQGVKEAIEPLYFMNQRRPHGPIPYQQGMQGTFQEYYNPSQANSMPSWRPPTHPSWSTPPQWSYPSQYHAQPAAHSFHSYAQPQPQWNAPHQGWGPHYNSPFTLLPPPPAQPQPLPPDPPRQPQMPTQLNPNPNNRQAQQVYSGEPSCLTYAMEIQEINLQSRKVLPDN